MYNIITRAKRTTLFRFHLSVFSLLSRHREELYPHTLLMRNYFPYTSVAIYLCFTPLLIRKTTTPN